MSEFVIEQELSRYGKVLTIERAYRVTYRDKRNANDARDALNDTTIKGQYITVKDL